MRTKVFRKGIIAALLLLTQGLVSNCGTGHNKHTGKKLKMSTMTSVELAKQMGTGWNLGNTLEHEKTHGGNNPEPTQQLFDAVKAAGFKTVRIPVAWSKFTDETNFTIDPAWLAHVEKVVKYAIKNDMYVIINEHFDGKWIIPTYAQQPYVNNRLAIMWKQIANHFKDYDYHLLFAATNEVNILDYYAPILAENIEVQNGYNQTFVNAVRSTGGRNALRYLVVQSYNAELQRAVKQSILPQDSAENRLLMEIHFYEPHKFSLQYKSTFTQWGSDATDASLTVPDKNESFVDQQFASIKTHFIDKGVGVILGEFGAVVRPDKPKSERFREYYINYISTSARKYGLVPIYWDNGGNGTPDNTSIFDRHTYKVVYPNILAAVLP